MYNLTNVISYLNYILPPLSLIILIMGVVITNTSYLIFAFWLSLIGNILLYQSAGGEILGYYFNYINASLYTVNLFIMIASLFFLIFKAPIIQAKFVRYLAGLVSFALVVGGVIILINLWINASFIEHKRPGTPIMQVVSFTPPSYCAYRYVFYKVGVDNKISYLCPNYYGLIPSVGHLDTPPEFLARQLTSHIQRI